MNKLSRVVTRALAAAVFLASSAVSRAQSQQVLKGIDVYGTSRFSAEDVDRLFGGAIRSFGEAMELLPKVRERAVKTRLEKERDSLRSKVESGIKWHWHLAWVRLSWEDYYKNDVHSAYLTIDVVEWADMKTRMPFRPAPRGRFSDPSDLLADWNRYSELGWSLVRSGEIGPGRSPCPGFYCTWGGQTAELKQLEDKFVELVPANRDLLMNILKEDKDPVHRAAAAYLLSYGSNGNELSSFMREAIQDPDPGVREAALRVFADLAVYHPDVYLPLDRIVLALEYPSVDDRNKALAVVVGLVDRPSYRSFLIQEVAPRLVKLLRLRQPANHDLAYAILRILSKENIGDRNYAAWEAWIAKAQKEPVQTQKTPAANKK